MAPNTFGEALQGGFNADIARRIAIEDERLLAPWLLSLMERRTLRLEMVEFGTSITQGSDWLQRYGHLTLLDTDSGDLSRAEMNVRRRGTSNLSLTQLNANSDLATLSPSCLYSVLALKNGPAHLYLSFIQSLLAVTRPAGFLLIRLPIRMKLGLAEARDIEGLLHVIPLEIVYTLLQQYRYSLILAEADRQLIFRDVVYFRVLAMRKLDV